MTVPGAVRLWADLAARFGRFGLDTRRRSGRRRPPRDGVVCTARIAHKWARAARAPWPAPAVGQRYELPELAATLQRIATEGPDGPLRG